MWSTKLPAPSRFLFAVVLVVIGAATVGAPALAQQGDWSAEEQGDRRREIVRRYREILESRPETGAIFDRLVSEVGTGAGLESLIEDYLRQAEAEPERVALRLIAGHLLRRAGRLQQAREVFEAALQQEPGSVIALRALGGVTGELDDPAASRAFFEQALELAEELQTQREILRELMDLAFAARQWDDAVAWGERLVELEPGNAYTRLELAELFVRHERYDSALEQYEWVSARAGTDTRQRAVAIKDQGDVLALMGRTDEAVERYRQAMGLVQPGYWLYREALQRLVDAYRQVGRLPEIVEELERTWSRPDLTQALLLADLYDELGRDDDTEQLLRQQVSRNPSSLDARLALVRLLERRGEYEEVIEQFLTLVRQSPSDPNYRFRLVDLYRRTGQRERSIETLNEMAERFNNDPDTLLEVADRLQRFDQGAAALGVYERVVRIDGDNPDSLIALGQFHFIEQRRSEAETVWRRILDTSLPAAEAHARLAEVYADFALVEEAVAEQQRAVDLQPDNAPYRRALASLFEDAQRLPMALDEWRWVLEHATQPSMAEEARQAIVRVYERLGRLSDVVDDWAFDLEMNPDDTNTAYLLGIGLTELELLDAAESTWQQVLARDPEDVVALAALERQYTAQNRIADAIDVISRLAALYPERAREYYYRLAELSLRQYDDESAVAFAQLAVELNPDDATAQARLGAIYRQMQQYDRAVAAYRQALALDERAFPFYFELADIYLLQDRPRAADELYRVVVAEAREESLVLRAGRRSLRINQAAGSLGELLGIMESRLTDPQVGEAQLKLLVEVYESIVAPLAQRARFAEEEAAAGAQSELESLARRALRPMLDALAGEDVLLRRRALGILGDLGNGAAVSPVMRLIENSDPLVRQQAAFVVARIADHSAADVIARALVSADAGVQSLLVWGLMRTGAEAVPALLTVATDPASSDEVASLALLGLGFNRAGSGVIEDALMSGRPAIQRAAAIAAGLAQEARLAPALRQWLMHGSEDTTGAVAWALGAFGWDEQNVALLARCVFTAPPGTRVDCGRGLDLILSQALRSDAVLAMTRSHEFIDLQTMSVRVDRFFHAIEGARTHDAPGQDSAVVSERIGRSVGEAFVTVLQSASAAQAVLSLSSVSVDEQGLQLRGTGGAMNALMRQQLLVGFRSALREHSDVLATTLNRIGLPDGAPLLEMTSLIMPEDPTLATWIERALESDDMNVRVAGLRSAGWTAEPRYLEAARAAIRSEDMTERTAAVVAIGRTGGTATELLDIAQTDRLTLVRATALQMALMADPATAWPVADRLWSELPLTARMGVARTALSIESLRPVAAMRAASDVDRAVRALVD